MGRLFCALVLFFVSCNVGPLSAHVEEDDSLCSHDHPLHPYLKLFDVIPEEWQSGNTSPNKKCICFTRIITTEHDSNGKELNKYSSYEITFGLPEKYKNIKSPTSGHEFDIYPQIEEETKLESGIHKKNVISIKCSKTNEQSESHERRSTMPAVNHDLDFLDDLDEICEEQLDIDVLESLSDEDVTPEPNWENTRRFGGDYIQENNTVPKTVSPESTTAPPDERPALSRFNGDPPKGDITTELIITITEILKENNTETTTVKQETSTLDMNEIGLRHAEINVTTDPPSTVKPPNEIRRSEEHKEHFIVQVKSLLQPHVKPECFYLPSNIKYGRCRKPLLPIRILTESTIPKGVKKEFVRNLEDYHTSKHIIVSGRNNCYLLHRPTNVTKCPSNLNDTAFLLEIDNLPERDDSEPFFSISFKGKCAVVSKNVDVIECPVYQDSLPHLQTDALPDHVRFKHYPGTVKVHVDDIVVHSFSHCLLLRAVHNVNCKKADIELEEDMDPELFATDSVLDDDIPTFRFGDYSFENNSKADPVSASGVSGEEATTPCEDDISTTEATPTTASPPQPQPDRKTIEGLDTRRTFAPTLTTEYTTQAPTTTTYSTIITEIKIPNSRKLSHLLKTIVDESATEPMPRSYDSFKPDFIVRIACAEQASQRDSCYYVSKYIMQPSFDVHEEFKHIIDKALLPSDAKIVPAPNLNIFRPNETLYATSGSEKFVLIKKEQIECPKTEKNVFFILDTGSCGSESERRDEAIEINPSIVKYKKGNRIYCFDFDENLKLHLIECPDDLSIIPVLSRPEDLKSLCRSQLKDKNQYEQMKILRRLNIVTDSDYSNNYK